MGRLSVDEFVGAVRAGDVRLVFGVIPGNSGEALGKAYPAQAFVDSFVVGGGAPWPGVMHALDISSTPVRSMDHAGRFSRGATDLWTIADLATIRQWPLHPGVAICFLDLVEAPQSKELVPWAPRSLLKQQVDQLEAMGSSLRCATELEFHLFDGSPEELASRGYANLAAATTQAGYRIDGLLATFEFVTEVLQALEVAGLGAESALTEFGDGQFEINLHHGDPVDMADRHLLYKLIVKQVAARHGRTASFMAFPGTGRYGSSCHVHASFAPDSGGFTGDRFGSFVAGQLDLATDLQLLLAPYPNSYRRYRPFLMTPIRLVAGHDNRTAACRLINGPSGQRVENRLPGADVNPYHVLAAITAMARHGISRDLAAPEAHDSLVTPALNALPVPDNFATAIANLEASERARGLLGDRATHHLLELARHEAKFASDQGAWSDDEVVLWEIARYLRRA